MATGDRQVSRPQPTLSARPLNEGCRPTADLTGSSQECRLDQADFPNAAEPADNGAEAAPTGEPDEALIQPSESHRRVTALYTAPAGIFLVDRRSGEVTPLATRGHTDIGDAPRRGAIVADLEDSDFLVYRTQTPLTCHHTVVLFNDGVTGLVSEREIGQIFKAAEHRDDAAEAILAAVNARGGSDNAPIIVCDFACPEG